MTQQIQVGTRVQVTAREGGLFYSANEGKTGTVVRVREGSGLGEAICHVEFDDGVTDYGRFSNVTVVAQAAALQGTTDAEGFISNAGNYNGRLPVPRGTLMDVLYNDGTLILDIPVGTGESKTSVNKPANKYSATTWAYHGTGSATIKAYRFPADRPGVVAAAKVVTIAHEDMKKGMKVRYLGQAPYGGHEHWNWVVGKVYEAGNGGPISDKGTLARNNWGKWNWELVTALTLDEQLAELKAELVGIKAEKARAEQEVTNAQERVATKVLVVEEVEGRRVALLDRLTKHGIQFIDEAAPAIKAVTALEAHENGTLAIGTVLLCVDTPDASEHTNGRTYNVIQRDAGDTAEWKLESNDGYGWWVENNDLNRFTVVTE